MCEEFLGRVCRDGRVATAGGVVLAVGLTVAIACVAAESLVSCASGAEGRVYRFDGGLFGRCFGGLGWKSVVSVVG